MQADKLISRHRTYIVTLNFYRRWYGWLCRYGSYANHKAENQHHIPYSAGIIFGITCFGLFSLLTASEFLFYLVFQQSNVFDSYLRLIITYMVLAVVLTMNFIGTETINRRVTHILTEEMKPPVLDDEFWGKLSVDIRYQIPFGIIISLLIMFFVPKVEAIYGPGIEVGRAFYLWVFITLTLFLISAYPATIASLNFANHIPKFDPKLYKFNPQDTPAIKALYKLYEDSVFIQSMFSSTIILGVVLINPNGTTFMLATIASIIALFIFTTEFLLARTLIGQLIGKYRNKVLDEIDAKLVEIYTSEIDSEEKQKQLNYYFELFDKVKTRGQPSFLQGLIGYILPIVWTGFTFFVVNFEKTQQMIIQLSQLKP